jgi:hypothetical protein
VEMSPATSPFFLFSDSLSGSVNIATSSNVQVTKKSK